MAAETIKRRPATPPSRRRRAAIVPAMSVVGRAHSNWVFGRRVRVLATALAEMVPRAETGSDGESASQRGELVDVGCGDGSVASALGEARPDLRIRGFEVQVRRDCRIPVRPFDGCTIPLPDNGADFVLLVDVLHHTEDPAILLAEARRVARRAILLKDHDARGLLARPTLRLMDWVGNAHHGVALPYNYLTPAQWSALFERLTLRVAARRTDLPLYPFPASRVFGRRLHFIARLERG